MKYREPIVRRVMSATVEDELIAAVHERAAAEDRSASSVVRQALRQFLVSDNGHEPSEDGAGVSSS